MATRNALIVTLQNLRKSIKQKNVVTIITNSKTVKKLLTLLEEEHVVKIKKAEKNKTYVQITADVTTIEVVNNFTNVKKEQVERWAAKLLPTINGSLILSTSAGLMTHREAMERQTGGRIIGFVF